MMGPTHALGGVAFLAGAAVLVGTAEHVPAWAYVVAAGSALIPDADNHNGSLLNRPYLLPLKLMSFPLWFGAKHRGRTHSILGLAAYGAMALFWGMIFNYLMNLLGGNSIPQFPLDIWVWSAMIGYFSHLMLDLLNIPGELLLWPLPIRIFFPPWRFHFIIPGRFATSTWQEHLFVNLPSTIFICYFFVYYAGGVFQASINDSFLLPLPGAIWEQVLRFLHGA